MFYQTHVKVHLDNIRDNLLAIRERVGEKTKILVAVKGNGYGHGSIHVSKLAQDIGMDFLGIATVPEAITLREAGIHLPILKFSPAFEEEMAPAVANDITLTVCERENIIALQEVAKSLGKRTPVHLKIDSGMGRIGVSPMQATFLAEFIEKECPNLYLEGVFTHMPVSDLADEKSHNYTEWQFDFFQETVNQINRQLGRRIEIAHCANSGDVLGHDRTWMDMVRPGIMVYGFYPDKSTPKTIALKPALSFYSRVNFIKKVKKGTPISYGQTWLAPRDTWIATVCVGYADGYNRLLSNRGRILINGRSYPVAGRVCMDQTMVDLGPETDVKVGDLVVLIGKSGDEEITAYEWADLLDTITYEVTCQIGPRVTRYYD